MKEYTIYQLWDRSGVKTWTAFLHWLERRKLAYYVDPARGVVVQVPE